MLLLLARKLGLVLPLLLPPLLSGLPRVTSRPRRREGFARGFSFAQECSDQLFIHGEDEWQRLLLPACLHFRLLVLLWTSTTIVNHCPRVVSTQNRLNPAQSSFK